MPSLLHPSYFPNIITMAAVVQHQVIWEVQDNYQKQTYRNRCYVCTDQGKHTLTIPIKHVGGANGRQYFRDVQIDNSYPWQRQHWRTLQTAYRTSPFFEFYEDDLAPLYEKKFNRLLDFNFSTITALCECLGLAMPEEKTEQYEKTVTTALDCRSLVNAKKSVAVEQPTYIQVFGDRHGFIENLSTLDLLFNEGTAALDYLKQLNLKLLDA